MVLTVWSDQQVCYVLHVNLEEAYRDTKHSLVRIQLNVIEYVLHGTRYNTELVLSLRHFLIIEIDFLRGRGLLLLSIKVALASKYGMRFARTCLAIRHDHTIESIEDIRNDWSGYLCK